MNSKITVDINDLLNLVNYSRYGEEDFEENGGRDHIDGASFRRIEIRG